jgi:hypothetical protein
VKPLGSTTANFGAGITVASLTVNSATAATAVLNIDPAATTGARTVTLTTGSEIDTLTNGFTVTAIACAPPPSGLVSWWPGDGNYNDIIGRNNDNPIDAVSFSGGEVGEAFNFGGTGYVDVPSTQALQPQQVSVAAWVQASSTGPYRYILDPSQRRDAE